MAGLRDKLKGKAKKVQGAITGSRSKKAEGVYHEVKGKLKETADDLDRANRPPK